MARSSHEVDVGGNFSNKAVLVRTLVFTLDGFDVPRQRRVLSATVVCLYQQTLEVCVVYLQSSIYTRRLRRLWGHWRLRRPLWYIWPIKQTTQNKNKVLSSSRPIQYYNIMFYPKGFGHLLSHISFTFREQNVHKRAIANWESLEG